MIVRIWRGWTRADDADAYRDYMTRVALPGYADVPGNLAVYLSSRRDDDREEFAMITVWESLDAVRAFAGDDPTRAVFYPDDDDFIVAREHTVTHYEVYGAHVASSALADPPLDTGDEHPADPSLDVGDEHPPTHPAIDGT